MLDHISIQCADVEASARPLGLHVKIARLIQQFITVCHDPPHLKRGLFLRLACRHPRLILIELRAGLTFFERILPFAQVLLREFHIKRQQFAL